MSMTLIILFFLYALIVLALTLAEVNGDRRAQYIFKPLAALGFCLIAIASGALETLYGQIILGALLVCALGDIFLLNRTSKTVFTLGMGAFAFGHIFYSLAVLFLPLDIELSLYPMIAITILCTQVPYFIYKSMKPHLVTDMKGPVAIYTLIISLMVFVSLSKIMTPFWLVSLAAVMFATSDYFVARDRFVKPNPKNALAITPLYFGAQALFAYSVRLAV